MTVITFVECVEWTHNLYLYQTKRAMPVVYFLKNRLHHYFDICIFCALKNTGVLAQLVEQRTENPCVPSSILGGAIEELKPTAVVYGRGLFVSPRPGALRVV